MSQPDDLPGRPRTARRSLPLVAFALLAAAGLGLVGVSGTLIDRPDGSAGKALLLAGTAVFVIGGAVTTRLIGNDIARRMARHGMEAPGAVVRMAISITGYLLVAITALGLLSVPLQQLLVGGAVTGVLIGIAAQQTLSNFFAGIMILVVRPFRVGTDISVRSGPLNGPFTGRVTALGLTYTTMLTEEGVLMIPNSTLLSAGITTLGVKRNDTGRDDAAPPAHNID
ncbi:mechanosensitive ion channel family protein [Solihabitans fulvus]|uniref:Mechanosensitive ion channel family protein n=1 Tax=Solihabitans fulvus TaxID=1892852 RepID=A0A5B2WQ40_9PSEU|nr:mechanosensitive ion channel family protein [Solihabitans fulvus]KAA2252559.1 mechanosensitive ion channel family protein [Solihabitans fulvus]